MYFFTLTVIADTKTIDQFDRGGFTDSNAKKAQRKTKYNISYNTLNWKYGIG